MTSVDPTIAPLIISTSSVHITWTKLAQQYANKSQTRSYSLPNSLSRLMKGTKYIAQYLNEIRSISDKLDLAGYPISTDELVIKVFNGLGPEYDAISSVICVGENNITYEELFEKLSICELSLLHTPKPEMPPLIGPLTAQFNQFSTQVDKKHQSKNRTNQSSGNWSGHQNNPNSGRNNNHQNSNNNN